MKFRQILLFVIFWFSFCIYAEKKTNVMLEQCDELTFDKQGGRDYQVLRGNVRFRHDDVVMFCDSAYFYDGKNSFDAFGHVRVFQNTETSMFSDSMFYDGNTTLMRVRGNVELRSGTSSLKTRFLDYYRDKNYGYYYGGGEVYDSNYHLTSYQGYYYNDSKSYLFKDTVRLYHPDYTIHADSLRYNQNTSKAMLIGPSSIYGKDYTVYTTRGWTYTNSDVGRLYNHSVILYKKGRRLTADSIAFDSKNGRVKAYQDAEAQDSTQKLIVRGEYMECDRTSPAYLKVLGNPYVIDYSDNDSLYLRADTLHYLEIDSLHEELRAYHRVRFYRTDLQGKCDSLVYFMKDSMAVMYDDPILWSEGNQLTGNGTIEIYIKDQKPEKIHIPVKAFIVSDEKYDLYNQLSGKEAFAYIEHNKLRRIDLIGDANSLYYSKDEKGALIGLNKAIGPEMSIYTKNNKLDKIIMTPESEGIMYPPNKIPDEERFLKNFSWREDERPKSKEDIFKK